MVWKPLIYKDVDLSKKFLISEEGDIFSIKNKKILKQRVNKEGYKCVVVSMGSRNLKKMIKTHIAVAYNFVDGCRKGLTVNHKDGNKINNHYTNLEWCTQKENIIHAIENNLLDIRKKVMCINNGMVFESIKDASDWCGFKNGDNISDCLRNKSRKTAGKHPVTGERLKWVLV